DPLQLNTRPDVPELDPAFYGLSAADLDQSSSATNTYFSKADTLSLRDMLAALKDTYYRNLGAEFMYMSDPVAKRWIQKRLESTLGGPAFPREEQIRLLEPLTQAEGPEGFLPTTCV